MNKETLDKGLELDEEIHDIREILKSEVLLIWNNVNKRHPDHKHYTTKEIDSKLREILTDELARKEKEFEEL